MFTKVAILASVLPLFFQSALAGPCLRSYTIQEGDICDSISAANNVSTYQLATINNGVIDATCSNLTPGNSICLGYENEDCQTTYVVQAQDTCDQIASNFGINSTILYGNNPQIDADCSNIYVGEVLCTLDHVEVPPASGPVETAIPSTATAAVSATPSSSSVDSTSASSVTPTPSASSDDADDNDDDLPFCDEL